MTPSNKQGTAYLQARHSLPSSTTQLTFKQDIVYLQAEHNLPSSTHQLTFTGSRVQLASSQGEETPLGQPQFPIEVFMRTI
jgi:hypothetical protein